MRPFYRNEHGVVCFRENSCVRYLLDELESRGVERGAFLMGTQHTQAEAEEFFQLIGYALVGYHELDEVSDQSALEASRLARESFPEAGGCRDGGCGIHCGIAQVPGAPRSGSNALVRRLVERAKGLEIELFGILNEDYEEFLQLAALPLPKHASETSTGRR